MGNFNANFELINIPAGTTNFVAMGYSSPSGSSIHQIYCLTAGSITVGAIGGGIATVPMTAGQTIDILLSQTTVVSGTYIGFRSRSNMSYGSLAYNGQ